MFVKVSAKKKHTGSSDGMRTSVETSRLLGYRAQKLVPNSLLDMTSAIKCKNFEQFAQLTMKVCTYGERYRR